MNSPSPECQIQGIAPGVTSGTNYSIVKDFKLKQHISRSEFFLKVNEMTISRCVNRVKGNSKYW